MSFLHLQLALAGLACVAIPIVIHLLMRRRRRPVMWGAMRFLLEAYRRQRRRLLIEKWLLLATRCLLVALLGLAIGRPLLGAIVSGGAGRTVYLLVDNGLAAGAVGSDARSALDRHKEAAKGILAALQGAGSEGDRAALVTLGAPAEGVVLPASADVRAVSSLVAGLEPVQSRSDVQGAISQIAGAIESDRAGGSDHGSRPGRTYVVVLSDFLEGSADLTSSLAKLPAGVRLVAATPAVAGAGNVAIVDLEPGRSVVVTGKTAGGNSEGAAGEQVRVTLRRSGPSLSRSETTEVSLGMAGIRDRDRSATLMPVGRARVQWSPNQETATAAIQAIAESSTGAASATLTEVLEARIEGAPGETNAVPGDDVWRRPVEVRDALRVGIVSPRQFGPRERVDRLDASEWLRLALRPAEGYGIEVTDLEPTLLDSARLAGLDVVCVPRPDLLSSDHWARIRLFLEGGGMLLVMPPSRAQVHLWSDAMVKELGLGWQVARETKSYGEKTPALIASVKDAPGTGPSGGLLAAIQSDLDDLARAVSVWKALPVTTEEGEGQRLLSLNDGTPLVLVQAYRGAGAAGAAGGGGGAAQTPASGAGDGGAATPPGVARSADRGLIVYFAVAPDLDWTDLPAKPLMVPLVQELVREGIGRAHGSWWSIAGGRPATPSRTAELHSIDVRGPGRSTGGAGESTAARVVSVDEFAITSVPLRRAGLWQAMDERGGIRGVVAVNPDTRGSRTRAQDRAGVEQWLGRAAPDGKVAWVVGQEPGAAPGAGEGSTGGDEEATTFASLLARESPGSPISLPLLVAALVLALFEVGLARWASHAEVSAKTGGRRAGVAA